jgi:3-phenylpropionate/trans-cinnamate dioxygenase ferredoxin reductase subunit
MSATMSSKPGMVVVGAGDAGLQAISMRDLGFDGAVTVIGGEPHSPYERPPLSKRMLFECDLAPPSIAGAQALESRGVRLLSGVEAVAVDRERQTVSRTDAEALPYRRLLIATGAQARPLGGHLTRSLRRLDMR